MERRPGLSKDHLRMIFVDSFMDLAWESIVIKDSEVAGLGVSLTDAGVGITAERKMLMFLSL